MSVFAVCIHSVQSFVAKFSSPLYTSILDSSQSIYHYSTAPKAIEIANSYIGIFAAYLTVITLLSPYLLKLTLRIRSGITHAVKALLETYKNKEKSASIPPLQKSTAKRPGAAYLYDQASGNDALSNLKLPLPPSSHHLDLASKALLGLTGGRAKDSLREAEQRQYEALERALHYLAQDTSPIVTETLRDLALFSEPSTLDRLITQAKINKEIGGETISRLFTVSGAIRWNQNRTLSAYRAYAKAIQHNPKNITAKNSLHYIYQLIGEIERAKYTHIYTPPVDTSPLHVGLHFSSATLLTKDSKNQYFQQKKI